MNKSYEPTLHYYRGTHLTEMWVPMRWGPQISKSSAFVGSLPDKLVLGCRKHDYIFALYDFNLNYRIGTYL